MAAKLGVVPVNCTVPITAQLLYCDKTKKPDFLCILKTCISMYVFCISLPSSQCSNSWNFCSSVPFHISSVPAGLSLAVPTYPPPVLGDSCTSYSCNWFETGCIAWLAAKLLLAGLSEVWRGMNFFFWQNYLKFLFCKATDFHEAHRNHMSENMVSLRLTSVR